MQWQDTGILIYTQDFGENSIRVNVLTKTHGKWTGLLKSSKKQKTSLQLGTRLQAHWQARLAEHLGFWKFDDFQPIAFDLYSQPDALYILTSACYLLNSCLAERHPYPFLYEALENLIALLAKGEHLIEHYINFELFLLKELGFELQLERCGATNGTQDLIYVSPKTGRAICAEAGAPYADKLLKMPKYFANAEHLYTIQDAKIALDLTGYFIKKHLLLPYQDLPYTRALIGSRKELKTG